MKNKEINEDLKLQIELEDAIQDAEYRLWQEEIKKRIEILNKMNGSEILNKENQFNNTTKKKSKHEQKKRIKTDFDYSSNCCPKNNRKKRNIN